MRRVLAGLVVLAGCGPAIDLEEASDGGSASTTPPVGSTSDSASSTSDTTSGTTSGGVTTLPPVTSNPVSSVTSGPLDTGFGETSGGSESSSGGDGCGPIDRFEASIWVNNGLAPGVYSWGCEITGLEYETVTTELDLSCEGLTQSLAIRTPLDPELPASGDVRLEVIVPGEAFSVDAVVKLTTTSGELLLASAQTGVFPGDEGIPADFFAPLSTSLLEDPCPGESDQGAGFIFCAAALRETIRFGLDGVSVDVLDKNREALPLGFEAAVMTAELQPPEQECAVPDRWYQWVVYRPLPL